MYGELAVPLQEYIEQQGRANEELVQSRFGPELEMVSMHLDLQHRVANHFVGLLAWGVCPNRGPIQLIFNAFQSNLFHISAALHLIRRGMIGSAWPILRVAYEGLLFAKLHTATNDDTVFQRWFRGDPYLSVRRDVLKKVKGQQFTELGSFWAMLCEPTHFSVRSGQPTLDTEYTASVMHDGFITIFIVLAMSEHILRRHLLSRSVLYYVQRYGDIKALRSDREQLKQQTMKFQAKFTKLGRQLIREFSTPWVTT